MQGLLFHFFFVTLCAVFSFVITGSFWVTLLLFVVFGVIPACRLGEVDLMQMIGCFFITSICICILFTATKTYFYIKENNCLWNSGVLGESTTILCNNDTYTFKELTEKIKAEPFYPFALKSKK
jgi:hypothetical protein